MSPSRTDHAPASHSGTIAWPGTGRAQLLGRAEHGRGRAGSTPKVQVGSAVGPGDLAGEDRGPAVDPVDVVERAEQGRRAASRRSC